MRDLQKFLKYFHETAISVSNVLLETDVFYISLRYFVAVLLLSIL